MYRVAHAARLRESVPARKQSRNRWPKRAIAAPSGRMKEFQPEVESMTEFIDGTGTRKTFPKSCEWCDQTFAKRNPECSIEFCSSRCEGEAAEEWEGYAIRVRGKFPRIGSIEGEMFTFPANPVKVMDEMKRSMDLFTFLQHPSKDGLSHRYFAELESLAIIPLTTFDDWWKKGIDTKTRNMVRKSEKSGVEIKETPLTEELLAAIFEMYNEVPVRLGRKTPHYGKPFEEVKVMSSTFAKRSIFLEARKQGKIVGFTKMVIDRDGSFADIIHFFALMAERECAAMNGMIAQAVRSCLDRRIPQLGYENFHYGEHQMDGLLKFKINNGFQEVKVPRYFVPKTIRGEIALKLGLHRRFRDALPESVKTRLRALRARYLALHKGSLAAH